MLCGYLLWFNKNQNITVSHRFIFIIIISDDYLKNNNILKNFLKLALIIDNNELKISFSSVFKALIHLGFVHPSV